MRFGRLLAALTIVALLGSVLPVGSAQGLQNPNVSTPTDLFFHINGFQEFPVNTQKPSDEYATAESLGLATQSTSCLPETPGTTLTSKGWHTFYGYSSPGYVEYDNLVNGKPNYHPERGISFDAIIDGGYEPHLFWYLETQTGVNGNDQADPNVVPVVVPQVKVRGTIREGDSIAVGEEHYNEGNIIMQGTSETFDLSPASTNYRQVGNKHVYEFDIPLEINQGKIPRATGYNIRVDVFMDIPNCDNPDNGYLMPNAVKIHTSPDNRPRMNLAIMNPIRIEYLHPEFVGDDLVIHTSMNSPWGNYDVDETPGGIEVSIEGPSEARSLAQVAFVQRAEEHDHHQEAVDVSYLWPYKQDGAQNGLYTVNVMVQNDARNAVATGSAQFEIGKGTVIGCGGTETEAEAESNTDCKQDISPDGAKKASKDSPGVGLIVLLSALAGLALARRRN